MRATQETNMNYHDEIIRREQEREQLLKLLRRVITSERAWREQQHGDFEFYLDYVGPDMLAIENYLVDAGELAPRVVTTDTALDAGDCGD
jgi:hypothetical protein